jgi:hypothetical protein
MRALLRRIPLCAPLPHAHCPPHRNGGSCRFPARSRAFGRRPRAPGRPHRPQARPRRHEHRIRARCSRRPAGAPSPNSDARAVLRPFVPARSPAFWMCACTAARVCAGVPRAHGVLRARAADHMRAVARRAAVCRGAPRGRMCARRVCTVGRGGAIYFEAQRAPAGCREWAMTRRAHSDVLCVVHSDVANALADIYLLTGLSARTRRHPCLDYVC